MKRKSKLSKFNGFLAIVLVICLIATAVVINKYPKITEVPAGADQAAADEIVIEELKAGTYGGVEFKTLDDVAAYYAEVYNNMKSKTAEYVDNEGKTHTLYAFLGTEDLQVGDVMIDGKSNAVVNKLVPGIVGGLYTRGSGCLPPYDNRDPKADNNLWDDKRTQDIDYRTCSLTGEDLLAANVTDNGDGTITMVLQPKGADMSAKGMDSQGRVFEVLGDIAGVVNGIGALSFTQGTAQDNIKVRYQGGTATIKIDTKTKEVVEADYHMLVDVAVTHASIAVIKDKSATIKITFDNHYPADDNYLKEYIGLTRK